MLQRCKEKLNSLALSVMNQWSGVKLRVTEGWDEEGKHATDSLHYEGRAVDVTTSDRDRSKYGMLARLAVEAGFDWVYYESRSHIHCSVKSDASSIGKAGGCFPGKSLVRTEDGATKRLEEVQLGERIAALDSYGNVVYSEVIAFLDRSPFERRQFIRLTTESGRVLTLTPAHLVPVEDRASVFAAKVQAGDRILVSASTTSKLEDQVEGQVKSDLRWDTVVEAKLVLEEGVFAPLTTEGTLLVNDVVASCYAVVDSQSVAHYAFLPLRIWHSMVSFFVQRPTEAPRYPEVRQHAAIGISLNQTSSSTTIPTQDGVHWYASLLYSLSSYVLPSKMLYD
ncbi:Sonic hedgehog protein A [Harpegnathos saltator]|uniref:Protein hedgehog n=1 Tax=Harpegnathos saltator TaxID=610380 RepID=E2BIW5_HARSA|nr:Sonic hedgehog protein A [Harpegnathos saltator]